MKNFTSIVLVIILAAASALAQKNTTVTDSFHVSGNCGMCKKRIEAASMIKGVVNASWNMDTQIMKVVYNSNKTSLEAIQQSIANIGHDTEKYKADEKAYKHLHSCCKYKSE